VEEILERGHRIEYEYPFHPIHLNGRYLKENQPLEVVDSLSHLAHNKNL